MQDPNQNKLSDKQEVHQKRISYQVNTWSSLSKELSIQEALLEIQSSKHKQQVSNLRSLLQNGNKEEYTSHKRTLPAVTFCGTFEGERKKSRIISYNSVIVLDVDKLDEKELNRTKECFQIDQYVFSFWESPSKEGLKGLVSLAYNFELNVDNIDRAHKSAFQKLAIHFKEKYNIELDNSGSDTTRLCFFSYDPAIIIKADVIQFEVNEMDLYPAIELKEKGKTAKLVHSSNQDLLYNPKDRNNPSDRYTMSAIIKCLEKKKLSITNSYEEWYKVAMAIANTFTYEIGMSDKGTQTAMYKITNFKVPKARLVTEGIDLANEIEFKTGKNKQLLPRLWKSVNRSTQMKISILSLPVFTLGSLFVSNIFVGWGNLYVCTKIIPYSVKFLYR